MIEALEGRRKDVGSLQPSGWPTSHLRRSGVCLNFPLSSARLVHYSLRNIVTTFRNNPSPPRLTELLFQSVKFTTIPAHLARI